MPAPQQRLRTLLLLSTVGLCASFGAAAQSYPSKPIRLIVPFPVGGATDILGRTLSQRLGERLGVNEVVDNKPGAGGSLGSDLAANETLADADVTRVIRTALAPKA